MGDTQQEPGDPIIFEDSKINPGGFYDNTTGIYTVPLDGTYEFYVHLSAVEGPDWYMTFQVDGMEATESHASNPTWYTSASMTAMFDLVAGQEVWARAVSIDHVQGTEPDGTIFSWFSGRLIYAN